MVSRSMLRIDRSRLTNATFPARVEIATRFDDLDMQGHVNNVAFAALFQEASIAFNKAHIRPHVEPDAAILVGGLFIDYVGQMYYPAPAEIDTGVLEIGRSSYVFGHRMRQGERITALCEVNFILGNTNGSIPLPDGARRSLEAAMVRPA